MLTRSPTARRMTLGHLMKVFQARKSVRKGEMAPLAPVECNIEQSVLGSPGALKKCNDAPTAARGAPTIQTKLLTRRHRTSP